MRINPETKVEYRGESVIFLAGPIQGTSDWQSILGTKLSQIFNDLIYGSNVIIASPRTQAKIDYQEQVDWETLWLQRAAKNGMIVFWLARETIHDCSRSYAQTTRFELGEWLAKAEDRVIIGVEEGFSGSKYISKSLSR